MIARTAWPCLVAFLMASMASGVFAQAATFGTKTSFPTGSAGVQPTTIVAGDVNGDGKVDLVVVNGISAPVGIAMLQGLGNGLFSSPVALATPGAPTSVAIGDLNGDAIPDLVVTNALFSTADVYLGLGGGAFGPRTGFGVGLTPFATAIADFNRDGKPDLVVANQSGDSISILLGNGDGTFGAAATVAVGDGPVAVAVADFNRDGIADLVVANTFSHDVSVLLGIGNGTFAAPATITTGGNPIALAVGDFNGDGKADIVVASGAGGVSMLVGNGNGTFAAPTLFNTNGFVTGLAVADFDGDGKLDVALSAGASSIIVMLGNGAGSFGTPTTLTTGATPRAIVAVDVNSDAIADLATADLNGGTASVLLNTTPYFVAALAWGDDRDGALGDGTTNVSAVPVGVKNVSGIVKVAAGSQHSVAVLGNGTVWSWGANFNGALGTGTYFFPGSTVPVQTININKAIAVAAGTQHTLALMPEGAVQGWGLNSLGQLGNATVFDTATPMPVPGLSGVVAVAAGGGHSLALKGDGTVWAFGRNDFGQLGDGTTIDRSSPVPVTGLTGIVAIAASIDGWHSAAVKADGTVWTWGRNNFGQLGDGSTVDRSTPGLVGGLGAIKAVAAGLTHSVALKADGTVWTWGTNALGQLGNGTTVDSFSPIAVPGLSAVTSVTSGMTHVIVLKADGSAWGWGANGFSGQLGDGTFTNIRTSPVQVVNLAGARAVATGGQHSVAIAPAATVASLILIIQDMNLPEATITPLVNLLDATQRSVTAGNTSAACGQLTGFGNLVQRNRGLTSAQAGTLVSYTRRIETTLGCSARR